MTKIVIHIPISINIFKCKVEELKDDDVNSMLRPTFNNFKNELYDINNNIDEEISDLVWENKQKYTNSFLDLFTNKLMQSQLLSQILGQTLLSDLASIYKDAFGETIPQLNNIKYLYPSGFKFIKKDNQWYLNFTADFKKDNNINYFDKDFLNKFKEMLASEMSDGWGENGSLELLNTTLNYDKRSESKNNFWNNKYNEILEKYKKEFLDKHKSIINDYYDGMSESEILKKEKNNTYLQLIFSEFFTNKKLYLKLGFNFNENVNNYKLTLVQ